MLTELLKQPQYQPMSMSDQALSLYAAKNGYMDGLETEDIDRFEKTLHRTFHEEFSDVVNEIEEKGIVSDELTEKINKGMEKTLEQITLVKGVN